MPKLPADPLSLAPLLALATVAVGLCAVGLADFRRRDVGWRHRRAG